MTYTIDIHGNIHPIESIPAFDAAEFYLKQQARMDALAIRAHQRKVAMTK